MNSSTNPREIRQNANTTQNIAALGSSLEKLTRLRNSKDKQEEPFTTLKQNQPKISGVPSIIPILHDEEILRIKNGPHIANQAIERIKRLNQVGISVEQVEELLKEHYHQQNKSYEELSSHLTFFSHIVKSMNETSQKEKASRESRIQKDTQTRQSLSTPAGGIQNSDQLGKSSINPARCITQIPGYKQREITPLDNFQDVISAEVKQTLSSPVNNDLLKDLAFLIRQISRMTNYIPECYQTTPSVVTYVGYALFLISELNHQGVSHHDIKNVITNIYLEQFRGEGFAREIADYLSAFNYIVDNNKTIYSNITLNQMTYADIDSLYKNTPRKAAVYIKPEMHDKMIAFIKDKKQIEKQDQLEEELRVLVTDVASAIREYITIGRKNVVGQWLGFNPTHYKYAITLHQEIQTIYNSKDSNEDKHKKISALRDAALVDLQKKKSSRFVDLLKKSNTQRLGNKEANLAKKS